MTRKFPAASKLAMLLAAAALVAVGFDAPASAQSKRSNTTRTAAPITARTVPTVSTSRARAPAFTSPRAPGSMPAPKCCRATANSRTTPFRRSSATRRSRAKTSTARSTASRSTRRRTWAAIRSASRCIESTMTMRSTRQNARSYTTGHFRFVRSCSTSSIHGPAGAIHPSRRSESPPQFGLSPAQRRVVALAKPFDRLGAEIAQALEDDLIRPVPPGDAAQAFGDRIGKSACGSGARERRRRSCRAAHCG